MDIKWRRVYVNDCEDKCISEVAIDDKWHLYHRTFNLHYIKMDDLQWKPDNEEAAKTILGFSPSKNFIVELMHELVKKESLHQLTI